MPNSSSKFKEQLVEISRLAYSKGMVTAFEGNLSVLQNDRIFITPSGVCKGLLTKEMIVVTDLNGNIIESNGYKPSSEIKLHLEAYKTRKDIGSVIHTHSPYSTAYALANKPIETKACPEMIMFFGKVPLAEYGTPSTDEICVGIRELITSYDVILLANHGVMSIGIALQDAFFKLEAVEGIAKTLTIAKQLGGEHDLPQKKLQQLYEMRGYLP